MEDERVPGAEEEGIWSVIDGQPTRQRTSAVFTPEGVEDLTYNNPYSLEIERVWFEGKIVYAVEAGEVEIDFDDNRVARDNKVAQEYQVVHEVELDDHGKLKDGKEPERVEGQYNIYDSVPGMEEYSALWQFNYVVVPRDYEPNTLRSEADCLNSGYPILKSAVVEN
jgi:hypothetical protein